MKSKLKYYLKSSYRRQQLDRLLNKYKAEYKGIVLDIGGRDRGAFKKPKTQVQKWIFADIEEQHQPDIILDVSNMHNIDSGSINVISALELFEHVAEIEDGIKECFRVLKNGGKLILSVPFLFPVHADPIDFQRWTNTKWVNELERIGFKIEKIEIMGRFFTILNGMIKTFIHTLPQFIRHFSYISIPFLNLVNKLDDSNWVIKHPKLGNYHGGYFIIAKKVIDKGTNKPIYKKNVQ